ncbi:MAG: hypothetical protein NT001_02880 [Candidatus Woesearchaeota archaeon]|nr:hypothetical protein [Candidatus Woesearchaeota archaeon]
MIYIHELKELNVKSADIESVPIIRAIKEKHKLPLSEESLMMDFSGFMVRQSDIAAMESAAQIIPSVMEEIMQFSKISSNAEQINLKRAHTGMQEIIDHLNVNINYAKDIHSWQCYSIGQMTSLINMAPSLKTREAKQAFNKELSPLFEKILRNEKFVMLFFDMIHEAQIERIKGIVQAMEEGTFFHFGIQEHLNRMTFSEMRNRLPKEELDLFDSISAKVYKIKEGVDAAYNLNHRMIGFAVQFYSYIKWLGGF